MISHTLLEIYLKHKWNELDSKLSKLKKDQDNDEWNQEDIKTLSKYGIAENKDNTKFIQIVHNYHYNNHNNGNSVIDNNNNDSTYFPQVEFLVFVILAIFHDYQFILVQL